ncbi:MAG: hypothetical protein JSR47_07485 [Proteobacteria bacterium]|nr:hypothetical protein [Pseudomonadota bacterium]
MPVESASLSQRSLAWCREISWSDNPIVWIDVAKLDAAWSEDSSYYLGSDVRTWPSSGMPYRYKRFGEWLAGSCAEIRMSFAGLDGGWLSFSDGRHRFAWLRDHGVDVLPIEASRATVRKFADRFGTAKRRSFLPLPVRYSLNDALLENDRRG